MRASAGANPPVTYFHNFDRILSTARFISLPDGAVGAVQVIFADTEVAQIT